MKKLLYKATASLCVALAATSCLGDVLEVESQNFDASRVFSNYTLAEYNVLSIAEVCTGTNSYRGRVDLYYGCNTDVELYKAGSNEDGWQNNKYIPAYEYNLVDLGHVDMNVAGNNPNPYFALFTGIERANICIEELRRHANLKDRNMAQLLGEALAWRAFYYYELVKMWGEVPLRTDPVQPETIYLPKADRDDIYLQILADLDEAIPMLYRPFESEITGTAFRINRATACGLYARIALSAAGYAWRPDDGAVGTGNLGSLRLSLNPELSKEVLYPKALAYLDEAVDMGNELEPSFEQLWRKFNSSEHVTSREVMFVRPYSDGRGRWNYHHAVSHDNSPYTGFSAERGGTTGPAPTLWWKYEKEDVRRDVTCVPWHYASEQGFCLEDGVDRWYWGKYRFEWMFNNPYAGGNDDGVKPVVMRYPDLLLMAAELAAYEGDLDKAKKYLLRVRNRAYAGNEAKAAAYVNALTIGSAEGSDAAAIADCDQPGTIMKAIIDERALEFAGEMLRKQDLIRWGLLKIKLDKAAKDIQALAEMTGDYAGYKPYSISKKSDAMGEYQSYPVYWRVVEGGKYPESGLSPVEVFGLEADQLGQTPADYTESEPNGWVKEEKYISTNVFFKEKTGEFRFQGLYNNPYNDPYPRSVWPHFAQHLMLSQGAVVNDYEY